VKRQAYLQKEQTGCTKRRAAAGMDDCESLVASVFIEILRYLTEPLILHFRNMITVHTRYCSLHTDYCYGMRLQNAGRSATSCQFCLRLTDRQRGRFRIATCFLPLSLSKYQLFNIFRNYCRLPLFSEVSTLFFYFKKLSVSTPVYKTEINGRRDPLC
jgi:hypothetical protein